MHHRDLGGTGKVLIFSQRKRERPAPKKGMDLLMINENAGEEDFRLVLLYEEIDWVHNWLERGGVGKFHLRGPTVEGHWLERTPDGLKIGYFKAKGAPVYARAEPALLLKLILQQMMATAHDPSGLLARMGVQDQPI